MKKIISVLCIFVLVLTCFAACGKGNTPTDASAEKWSKLCESDADEEIAAMKGGATSTDIQNDPALISLHLLCEIHRTEM